MLKILIVLIIGFCGLIFFKFFLSDHSNSGEYLYSAKCRTCHGEDGNKYPMGIHVKIGELKSDEIIKKVKSFHDSKGISSPSKMIMQKQALEIKDEELKKIALYLEECNCK